MSGRRVLLYVQHLLGIGHLKRGMTLARALAAGGLEVTVASGGFAVPELAVAGVRMVQLPPVGAADMTFKNLVGAAGTPIDDEWKRERREALLAVYREVDPHALLIELFPFGRRQMRFELLPLLDLAIAVPRRPLIVSSVRDVGGGGQREPSRQAETIALVQRYFDRVLVHSDPAVIRFERTYAYADEIADKLHYTGFVVERGAGGGHDAVAGKDEVIVSAGGGAVGRTLLEIALQARPLSSLATRTWRLLLGINATAADAAMLEALAGRIGGGRVIIERVREDFTTLLRNCAVSVSQAGYNTTMEILDAGARAVLVPFAGGAETEQTLRATLLAENERLQVVAEAALTAAALAAAVDRAARGPAPARGAIDLGGAERSAVLLARWLAERSA
ncbi:MAG: glycosyl transferase family 28 [Betaproteobacteria bacterium]|nr:glycosyl transferase family 28 [Betaproteobacteria bacterium]